MPAMKDENTASVTSRYQELGYMSLYLILIIILPRFGVLKGLPQLISYIVLGICGYYVFRKEFAEGFNLWKTHFLKNIIWLIATLFGGLILQQLAAVPAYLLGSEDLGGNTEAIFDLSSKHPILLIILALGLLGPITEEIIYRIILVGRVSKILPGTLCVAFSSLIFMYAHARSINTVGLANALPILAIALTYAFVYYKTKNITIPVTLHMLNNSISLLFMIG
jgi:membrane protease YdiL (CAAX protease family)